MRHRVRDREFEQLELALLKFYRRTRGEGPEWRSLQWMLTQVIKGRGVKYLGDLRCLPSQFMNLLARVKDLPNEKLGVTLVAASLVFSVLYDCTNTIDTLDELLWGTDVVDDL